MRERPLQDKSELFPNKNKYKLVALHATRLDMQNLAVNVPAAEESDYVAIVIR